MHTCHLEGARLSRPGEDLYVVGTRDLLEDGEEKMLAITGTAAH